MMSVNQTLFDLPGHPEPVLLNLPLRRIHEIFEQLADRYGTLFTVQYANRPMVVVADAQLIKYILCKRPELFAPYHKNSRVLTSIKADGIEAADDEDWRRQRALIAGALESGYLSRYFTAIRSATEDLKNRWLSYGENLSRSEWETEIFAFSMTVFTAVVFGDMNALPAGQRQAARTLLENVVPILGGRIDDLLPQMHLQSFVEDKGFDDKIEEIRSVIETLVRHNRKLLSHRNSIGATGNLLEVLMSLMAEQNLAVDTAKLVENILQILLASEATTANTLLRVLHYLAADPDAQQEVRHEVDRLLVEGGMIEGNKDGKKLKCMEAVIYETMRLASVSRFVIMETKTEILLNDVAIPGGTPFLLLIGYCGLDPQNFQQADVFDHRRWLGGNKTEAAHTRAIFGFGAGPRSCPGRGLAMLVIKTALAMICGNFCIRPVVGDAQAKHFPLDFTLHVRSENQVNKITDDIGVTEDVD